VSALSGSIAERALLVRGVRLATAVNTVPREQLGRPPLVVLPAAGHTWHDYQPVLERFAAERRVAAVDWPGFGGSDRPAPAEFAYTAESYAGLLGPWLDALGIARAVLLGNSVGAAAAIRYALAQPDRVAGLLLVAPGGFAPPGPRRSLACRVLGTPWVLARVEPTFTSFYLGTANPATRAIVATHRARRRTPEYAAYIAAYAALWRSFDTPTADLTAEAKALQAPTFVVRGALDPVITAADARRATAAIGERGALEVVLPNAGHLPFLQQMERFLSATRGLLETVEAGAQRG
jgi:pimeloyl-ACP methyl ester carboxylesterase